MSKENVVEIPTGSGNRYRYIYDPETQKTLYLGPVGSAPAMAEQEFLSAIPLSKVRGVKIKRKFTDEQRKEVENIANRVMSVPGVTEDGKDDGSSVSMMSIIEKGKVTFPSSVFKKRYHHQEFQVHPELDSVIIVGGEVVGGIWVAEETERDTDVVKPVKWSRDWLNYWTLVAKQTPPPDPKIDQLLYRSYVVVDPSVDEMKRRKIGAEAAKKMRSVFEEHFERIEGYPQKKGIAALDREKPMYTGNQMFFNAEIVLSDESLKDGINQRYSQYYYGFSTPMSDTILQDDGQRKDKPSPYRSGMYVQHPTPFIVSSMSSYIHTDPHYWYDLPKGPITPSEQASWGLPETPGPFLYPPDDD